MQRILIVDDEENIREMTRLALEAAGYEVAEAGTGLEAFAIIGSDESWDAVLLDQKMPGMVGTEVLRRLIDPNSAMLRAEPRDVRDVMIAATNSWLLAIDNISDLQPWLSDCLCRLSTGGGFSTRELYTDMDQFIPELDFHEPRPWHEHLPMRPRTWQLTELNAWGAEFSFNLAQG